MYATVLRK